MLPIAHRCCRWCYVADEGGECAWCQSLLRGLRSGCGSLGNPSWSNRWVTTIRMNAAVDRPSASAALSTRSSQDLEQRIWKGMSLRSPPEGMENSVAAVDIKITFASLPSAVTT
jgi:hypothetical protein